MDIKEYLQSKGLRPVMSGKNWTVDCPFCDDDRKRLGIHSELGKWNCFNCSERGKSIRSLQKKLDEGDVLKEIKLKKVDDQGNEQQQEIDLDPSICAKHAKRLWNPDRGAHKYLTEVRGFSDATIKHFQLGSWKKSGFEYVSIPFWERGKLVNLKFRGIDYQDRKFKWRRKSGGKSALFNDDVIYQDYDHVFLTEAELDAIALWNAGIKNVIAVTTGAKSFKQEWYEKLRHYKKIYLVYDNDVDGQDGAEKAAHRLGFDRCFNIKLPSIPGASKTDANSYFWDEEKGKGRHTKKDFMQLVKFARRFEVKNIVLLRDALKDVYKARFLADEEEIIGFQTPWKRVNNIIGGAKPGHLVVVSGGPKIGKTTFAVNWLNHVAKEDEAPGLLYCCEMKQVRLAERQIAMTAWNFTKPEDITEEQIFYAHYALPTDKIYLGYPQTGELNLDSVCEQVEQSVQRYGCRFVIFDNLHFLVRTHNVKEEIGMVTRAFKILAERLNIVFVLIVHPKKIGNREPTHDDLKDSSSIYQDLDTLIFLHRAMIQNGDSEKEGDEGRAGYDPLTKVIITGRWCEGGYTKLYYEGNRALFHEKGSLYQQAMQKELARRKQKDEAMKGRNR